MASSERRGQKMCRVSNRKTIMGVKKSKNTDKEGAAQKKKGDGAKYNWGEKRCSKGEARS